MILQYAVAHCAGHSTEPKGQQHSKAASLCRCCKQCRANNVSAGFEAAYITWLLQPLGAVLLCGAHPNPTQSPRTCNGMLASTVCAQRIANGASVPGQQQTHPSPVAAAIQVLDPTTCIANTSMERYSAHATRASDELSWPVA